ncbi:MAG TPA: EthD family reductase [Candidatus Dormibacteraeota bacterium]|nr:EthD family reductase [Candidatus Dormibacteraeota bacterium]
MTTLLVLYRAPEGGADALATLERRYRDEHLPLVAQTPGLRSTRVSRVAGALGGETDLALVAAMDFDDRAALDDGLRSDPMRAAGRILREIAPGLATLLVLEDAPDLLVGDAVA